MRSALHEHQREEKKQLAKNPEEHEVRGTNNY